MAPIFSREYSSRELRSVFSVQRLRRRKRGRASLLCLSFVISSLRLRAIFAHRSRSIGNSPFNATKPENCLEGLFNSSLALPGQIPFIPIEDDSVSHRHGEEPKQEIVLKRFPSRNELELRRDTRNAREGKIVH